MHAHERRAGRTEGSGQRAARSVAGPPLSAASVVAMQSAAGNRAVSRMIAEEQEQRAAPREEVPVQRTPAIPAPAAGGGYKTGLWTPSEKFRGQERAKEATMISDGQHPAGSSPQGDPAGYDYIRQLKLTNYWIRFHLVNEEAGGAGRVANLVPASKGDNGSYERQFEKDLKSDVTRAGATPGDYVFFGASVNYRPAPPPTAPATTRQQDSEPFFPASLKIYQEYFSGATGRWKARHTGSVFTFQDPPPADTLTVTGTIPIASLTLDQLSTLAPGYEWTAADLAFLHTLGAAREEEFELAVAEGGGTEDGPEGVVYALEKIKYQGPASTTGRLPRAAAPQATVPFAARIDSPKAIAYLAAAIARGEIII